MELLICLSATSWFASTRSCTFQKTFLELASTWRTSSTVSSPISPRHSTWFLCKHSLSKRFGCNFVFFFFFLHFPHQIRKASYKEPFTHWLPLYINPTHGAKALPLVKEAMAKICTEAYGSFEPWMIIEVVRLFVCLLIIIACIEFLIFVR